jgi:hypothetical protein
LLTFPCCLICQGKHEVLAPRENLPPNVRQLPKDTDVMVTFATGAVSTMAVNWVETGNLT